ncbi:MAG: glycoside hydrolase family 20 zincin-like fold domain-containing protein, partial [Armatimonadota bacterium]
MRNFVTLALLTGVLCGTLQAAPSISAGAAQPWLRQVIPLPKQVQIEGFARYKPSAVAVRLAPGASDVTRAAADLLRHQLGESGSKPAFTVLLGVCDRTGRLGAAKVAGADRLAACKNSDQAYVIVPEPGRLVLTGLSERGVYYAALTLSQLLRTKLTADSVTVPMVRVLDWPDLAERGEWGGNAPTDVEWMSAHKLNLAEVHANVSVDDNGVGHATFSQEMIDNARLHAFKMVPIIHHLDQQQGSGLFRVFPELKGVGPKSNSTDSLQTICFSKPQGTRILGEWMTDLAKLPGVTDLCVWLSEDAGQCGCEECAKSNQFVLETRACVAAWREASKVNPALKLRLLLTQGTYQDNAKVLTEAPPEVNISYYDGGRTYDSSRDPMIYPLLEDFAKQGRWLGVYPQIIASWRIVCPWSGPQFMKYRLMEFVDKGLTNLCAYATPNNRLYDFNVTAAAEWSWNAHGRSEREFATAWAIGRGLKAPDKAAEWALTLGNVGWDVYGSRIPYTAFFGEAARMIRDRAKPVFGKGMFRYFETPAKLQADLLACEKAEKLAAELNFPEITAETQVIGGYLKMLSELDNMANFVTRTTPPTEADRLKLQATLGAFAQAGAQSSDGLRAWVSACLPDSGGSRLGDTIQVTEQTVTDVANALAPLGVRTGLLAYMSRQIGVWQDSDFEEKQTIRKQWDVTTGVLGPGTYQLRPVYTKGWNGLNTSRVALATAPKDQPDKLTEVVVDAHHSFSGAEPKDDLFTLQLPAYDPNVKYFILADIQGTKSSDKPVDRRGCNGVVNFWKVRQPGEVPQELPLLPMSDAEKARFGATRFTKPGLHVGIVPGY